MARDVGNAGTRRFISEITVNKRLYVVGCGFPAQLAAKDGTTIMED